MPQERRTQDGKIEETDPRVNCPYCHVARVPHLVKDLIPFRDMAAKQPKAVA